MSVEEIVLYLKLQGDSLRKPVELDGIAPMVFACEFAIQGVDSDCLASLHTTLPQQIIQFWMLSESARLFVDCTYGQWGLHILSPNETATATHRFEKSRNSDFRKGDLVIGRFLGDSDLLIARCDNTEQDFGSILVGLPLDPRTEWPSVADTFEEFLRRYTASAGDKYWQDGSALRDVGT